MALALHACGFFVRRPGQRQEIDNLDEIDVAVEVSLNSLCAE
ncbi:hypothetical protein [Mycobacterium sp.]|nr:hypothetical protein [Mycobacterium sp.]